MSRFLEPYLTKASELIEGQTPFVTVTLVHPEGHVPQDIGAKAIVSSCGLLWGTVGGGKLEAKAISQAKELLELAERNESTSERLHPLLVRYDLKQDLGMVCGGAASLFYEVTAFKGWNIAVFGAGHVAQAVIPVLATLHCKIICIDHRPEWLARIPVKANIHSVLHPDLPSTIDLVPADSFYVVMTQGHATDLPVVREILKRGKPRYLGVIGSLPKSRTLKATLKEEGFSDDLISSIICPIGLNIGTNEPGEIAVSIAAQILEYRDRKD
ncbi:MAG: xanthine dehydrogenase accessory protein XdhC [Proteobacteria bacterium]|nr:xanthine dehydrogenase accessory protein XdhC [Pseudomonadota bacterium]